MKMTRKERKKKPWTRWSQDSDLIFIAFIMRKTELLHEVPNTLSPLIQPVSFFLGTFFSPHFLFDTELAHSFCFTVQNQNHGIVWLKQYLYSIVLFLKISHPHFKPDGSGRECSQPKINQPLTSMQVQLSLKLVNCTYINFWNINTPHFKTYKMYPPPPPPPPNSFNQPHERTMGE